MTTAVGDVLTVTAIGPLRGSFQPNPGAHLGASVHCVGTPVNKLAGGGYTFPTTDWDDASFVQPYGGGGSANAAATSFKIPTALGGKRFRIGFTAYALSGGGTWPASNPTVQVYNDIGATPNLIAGVPTFWDSVGSHNVVSGAATGIWEGTLAANDVIVFDTSINAGATDKIQWTEWFIECLNA